MLSGLRILRIAIALFCYCGFRAVAFQDRAYVRTGRLETDPLDELPFRERCSVCTLRPFVDTARAGIVSSKSHRGFCGPAAKLRPHLFEIPTADLNISFRILKQLLHIFVRLPFELAQTCFLCPFASDERRNLH